MEDSASISVEAEKQLTPVQKRLIDILNYIEKAEKLNQDPFFTIDQHRGGFAEFQHKVSGMPGVYFNVSVDSGDEIWLKVDRIVPEPCPVPDDLLREWIVTFEEPTREPELKESIVVRIEYGKSKKFAQDERSGGNEPRPKPDEIVEEVRSLNDCPDVASLFSQYREGPWKSWSIREAPRRKSIELYGRLFELQRTIELEGSVKPLEVVWGVGIAVWNPPGHHICYPIINQLVDLAFDHDDNSIVVRPRDTDPHVETSAFYALGNPGTSFLLERGKIWQKDVERKFSPFARESFEGLLRAAVSHLDKTGQYWPDVRNSEEDKTVPPSSANLVITDTWVLFARPRTSNFLLRDLVELKNSIEASEDIGGGPSAIVSDPGDDVPDHRPGLFRGVCGTSSSGADGSPQSLNTPPKELFFPKPYNQEQLCIIDLLQKDDGVVVQGPPGTGKTHTIANIICHYLANGKRVLVTSKGEPALAVIRDQIPEGIRSLVVSILTNDREGLRQLQSSVEQIGSQITSASSQAIRFQIRELKSKLDLLHEKIAAWEREIASIAERHLTRAPFGENDRLPSELAEEVMKEAPAYSWFPDELGVGETFAFRLSQAELDELTGARKAVGEYLPYLDCEIPSADNFCDPDRLLEIHANLVDLSTVSEKTRDPRMPRLRSTSLEGIQKSEELLHLVRHARALFDNLENSPCEWVRTFHGKLRMKRGDPVLQQILHWAEEIDESEKARLSLISNVIELSEDAELVEALRKAIERAADGERAFALLDFSNKEAKRLLRDIRINGVHPQNKADWDAVKRYTGYLCRLRLLVNKWNGLRGAVAGPELIWERRTVAHHVSALCGDVVLARELSIDIEDKLRDLCEEVFTKSPVADGFYCTRHALNEIERLLTLYLPQHKLKTFEGLAGDFLSKTADKRGEIVARMRSILSGRLGKEEEQQEQLRADWAACLKELRNIESLRGPFAKIRRITQEIAENGAPIWAEKLRTVPAGNPDPLMPSDAIRAWNWKLRHAYLLQIDQREKLKYLAETRAQAETDLQRTYEEYIKSATWLALKESLSNKKRSALQAYLSALRHLPKGKGRTIRGDRFRGDARKAMEDACAAVPCWIMPHWRVSEALPPEMGLFDLVIIDEASQSDIWALPALLRGKRLLVVGDDEQISPTTFAREEDILRLRDQYLSSLPHNFQAQVLPGKSIYDLARVVFPQSHITLVEHFRCVAPIIEFSNQLCYNGRIRCLRVPKASERIDPPLVDVLVKGGYRDGKRNNPEARAILKEISKLVSDRRFEGRSIGVVSLLGNEQACLVNQLILEQLGEDVVQRFNILCGDSMTFQGNERDIMFLSMVATPEDAVAQTKREIRQRFNVACSRARDRMYLYRSVRREDLSGEDLRARLIEHFEMPLSSASPEAETLRDKCQSSFELALFDALVERGYQVIPQVECSGYYIDLVVEGDNDRRLAVECDGDQYHGPEKWADDFGRQRVLERAGWRFWRCWGSSFYLDPEACLDDLIQTLDSMGIAPIARPGYVPPGLVEHREVDPNAPDEQTAPSTVESVSLRDGDQSAPTVVESTVTLDQRASEQVTSRDALPSRENVSEDQEMAGPRRRDGYIDIGEVVEFCFLDAPETVLTFKLIEVGPTDHAQGVINVSDPIGAMLLGLQEGVEVGVPVMGSTRLMRILKIHDLPSSAIATETPSVSPSRTAGLSEERTAVDFVPTPDYSAPPSKPKCGFLERLPKELLPYRHWTRRLLPDPRVARPREVLDGLVDIVRAEAPIVCERAYQLYCDAANLGRMGAEIRRALDKAVISGMNRGALISSNEFGTRNRLRNVLRPPGQPDQLPREAAGRTFEEIPPSEIASAMLLVYAREPALSVDELYRRTLGVFGLQRLSERFRGVLSMSYRNYFHQNVGGRQAATEEIFQ